MTYDEIVNAAKYFHGIETIALSGGEPSIHPELETWVPKLKELFGCKNLDIDTNGTMFKKKPEIFRYFDNIYVSNYPKDFYPGLKGNKSEIDFILNYYPDKKFHISGEMVHIDRKRRLGGSCFRESNGTVHYANGRLYPCCVGPGLDTKVSIPLTENWKEEILKTYPPCNNCFLAEGVSALK